METREKYQKQTPVGERAPQIPLVTISVMGV